MAYYFECKVTYEKNMGEDEGIKKTTETYLIEEYSFSSAEKRVVEEVTPFLILGTELTVSGIRRVKVTDLFEGQGDKWYRCKVNLITVDEDKGIEKRTAQFMMVSAADLEEAVRVLSERLAHSQGDYDMVQVTETPIMDVLHYVAPPAEGTTPTPAL